MSKSFSNVHENNKKSVGNSTPPWRTITKEFRLGVSVFLKMETPSRYAIYRTSRDNVLDNENSGKSEDI